MSKQVFKIAFPYTLPVLAGYLMLGAVYGMLMAQRNVTLFWTMTISLTVFAGALQFAAIPLLSGLFQPFTAFLMALMINFRHIFYGLALLVQYRFSGWKKPFMIFGLADETFAINSSISPPNQVNAQQFYFSITLYHYLYWQIGTLIGYGLGFNLGFDLKGLDFVLTALFTVLLVEQWQSQSHRLPALLGIFVTIGCYLVFPIDHFLIPSMIIISLALLVFRKKLDSREVL